MIDELRAQADRFNERHKPGDVMLVNGKERVTLRSPAMVLPYHDAREYHMEAMRQGVLGVLVAVVEGGWRNIADLAAVPGMVERRRHG